MIAAIDERDLSPFSGEAVDNFQPAKSGSDHNDARARSSSALSAAGFAINR
ncbi:hypothetical protein [Rhizobium sp. Root651]|uniref:hypothetical protein n=1 Tax=Rhizobium sp. Root651 TaxID=1736577 RepID=UPI00256FD8E6|nr:hypothetical protein [Rhizobium sp. Root651]